MKCSNLLEVCDDSGFHYRYKFGKSMSYLIENIYIAIHDEENKKYQTKIELAAKLKHTHNRENKSPTKHARII